MSDSLTEEDMYEIMKAAILYWFKDDDCKSNSKLWNHFKEN